MKVGGTGGWDYLLADTAAHFLYITHDPRVEVLDSGTGKAVAAILGIKGTHGIALEFVFQLDAVTETVVDVEVGYLVRTCSRVAVANPPKVGFPVLAAWSLGVVGPEGWPALCAGCGTESCE